MAVAAFASRLDIPGASSLAALALPDLTEEFVSALIETHLNENEVLVEASFYYSYQYNLKYT